MAMMSTPKQRQQIGMLRKMLGLSDEVYHDILWSWGVDSSKDLSAKDAETFLKQLKEQAIQQGVYKPKAQYKAQRWKYNNYSDRDETMATPAQLRMIEALWFKISYQKTDEDRENALNTLCEKITGKARLIFITKIEVRKIVKALETMQAKQKERVICQT